MIPFVDINSGEFLLIIILALLIIGPKRLPEYAANLRRWVRQARDMADGAKTQLKGELGPEFQDIDWRQYDPRQYDPRKIVREALFDDPEADVAAELGLTDRSSGGSTAVAGPDAAGVGAEFAGGVGAEDAEISGPSAPRAFVDNTYHPDREVPFDIDAT